jgi:PleD family two-component response regulator
MPGTDADGAYCFADRLQAAITASPLLPEDLQLSVSVGVAEADPDMSSIAALLKLAEERLAAGKRSRRHALANGDQAGAPADKPRSNPAGGRSS